MLRRFCAALAVPLALAGTTAAPLPADLIVRAAHIYTSDPGHRAITAFAVRDGRFVAIGGAADVAPFAGPHTSVLDLGRATVLPGLIDAHLHLEEVGAKEELVDLSGTLSEAEMVARVAARARGGTSAEWIIGRGWDHNRWPGAEFPTHAALDAAVPDRPAALLRVDGHALLANAVAMRIAGITAATPDPPGGRIVRDATGAPTGVFIDNAQDLVRHFVPPPDDAAIAARLRAGAAAMLAHGVTTVHDPGEPRAVAEVVERLAARGELPLRDYVLLADDPVTLNWAFARGPVNDGFDGHLWLRGIKLYADGALGSRGAALLAPYADDPANSGLLVSTPDHIERTTEEALRRGFQVATQAIGDRANRLVLNAYAQALRAVPVRDARLRVEHAHVIAPDDVVRFATLGVIPSMQSSHQASDMAWAERRLGAARVRGAYAWRALLRTGVHIANGTDAPVESVDPLITFHSAVTRQDAENRPPGGWYPDQRMTRDEALASMTRWAAEAGFQDRELGQIAVGYRADFVAIDRDIMTVPPERILGARVRATYVGGKRAYAADVATLPNRR